MESYRFLQLYRCIDSLTSLTGGESNPDIIVGYIIAKSLLEFDPGKYGREPRSFKETWAVYQGLSESARAIDSQKACEYISQLKEQVNGKLTQCLTDPESRNKESDLLEKLVEAARKKNVPIEELLREIGSGITQSTMRQGLLTGAINRTFNEDYKLLEKVLSR